MFTWHLLCYRYEALRTATIEDAIRAMHYEVETGTLLFGMQL